MQPSTAVIFPSPASKRGEMGEHVRCRRLPRDIIPAAPIFDSSCAGLTRASMMRFLAVLPCGCARGVASWIAGSSPAMTMHGSASCAVGIIVFLASATIVCCALPPSSARYAVFPISACNAISPLPALRGEGAERTQVSEAGEGARASAWIEAAPSPDARFAVLKPRTLSRRVLRCRSARATLSRKRERGL